MGPVDEDRPHSPSVEGALDPWGARLFVLALGAAAGILFVFAWPMFEGRVFVANDLGNYTLLGRAFQVEAMAAGDSFHWWPHLAGGSHLHGLGPLGLAHPLRNWSYALLPMPWPYHLEVIASYPFMLLGVFLLLRRWRLDRSSAGLGALLATFSGFMLLHHVHANVVAVAAHVPWLLLAMDVGLRAESRRLRAAAALAVTLLTGSQLLVHFPQVVVMSLQLETVYGLAVGLGAFGLGLRRFLPWWLVAKLLGLGLGMAQLLPAFDYLQYTVRGETSVEFRSMLSLHPANLVQLLSPYLFDGRVARAPGEAANLHELGFYAGCVSIALLVYVAIRWRALGTRRRWALGLGLVALAGLDLSLGKYGFLYHVQVRLPLIGLFRAPARNAFVVHLALAGLAALAFDDLRRLVRARERIAWKSLWPLALPALLSLGFVAWWLPAPSGAEDWLRNQVQASPAVFAGTVLAAAAGLLVALSARGHAVALGGLILLAAGDLGVYGLSYVFEQPPVSWKQHQVAPQGTPEPDPLYRVHGGQTRFEDFTPNGFTLYGLRVINGYQGANAEVRLDYRELKPLQVAGVQWVYRNDLEPPVWQEVAGALPRVRLVTRSLVSARPRAALLQVNPRITAVVDAPVSLEPGRRGVARLVEDRPGKVEVETRADSRQLLVYAEGYLADWRVFVDDEPATLVRAYGDFMACVVPAGEHRVSFRFEPRSTRAGERVSLVSLALCWIVLGGLAIWPERRAL